ncbi:SDR family NAD(P)-dependent oxidoreductase [Celeribacter indicus]|uniref:Short-chain dehydrogenase/reductase SDR n=1 Tax=Celeribacter indicus TaxID=1208324 RepID=A0A0B5E051_9RHOB|nr:SDR family NAD(P)-dependent oxidoreductase [Celeribacter indicus]AJE45832.1 short-chain dehydrogenase/reductase SDR [Celeribacter indicus]SDW61719.1 NADP-dependent 3-hydroxy acid dehydrogenase YdfG [Celeribacter indicus]
MSHEKVWFVTGASGGFGRLWSEAALERGDKVVATARKPQALDALVQKYGDAVLVLPLDVTDRAAVFDTVAQAHHHFGRLDVILSNAGYGYMSAVEEIDIDKARANFETNVWGTLNVLQAVLPCLRAQGSGHILTLSSIAGMVSLPTGGSYIASKWAVEALSEGLAGEVAGFGIKVTIVEPGSFSTGFRAATQLETAMPAYAQLRADQHGKFNGAIIGDPDATVPAILKLVDSEDPPLRLILGNWLLPMVKDHYRSRLETWEAWADVSNAAQGAPRV